MSWVATLSSANKFTATAAQLIRRAPAFWEHIWDNRHHLTLSPAPVNFEGMADNFMALILAFSPNSLYTLAYVARMTLSRQY